MSESHTYTTSLTWQDTRRGMLASPGLKEIEVATPPQFPGGIDGLWSPEHLFVAAAEICLMTTFLAIAENSKLTFQSYKSEAVGTLEKTDQGYMVTGIVLKPTVVISDESLVDRTTRILEKANSTVSSQTQ